MPLATALWALRAEPAGGAGAGDGDHRHARCRGLVVPGRQKEILDLEVAASLPFVHAAH